jgi:tetratricopeptide (TPR) repeat protein
MNLGAALTILGEWEGGTARLGKAVEVYHEVLEEWTRKQVPLTWAATQFNLGNALMSLGEREGGTAHLGKAIEAYHEALEEWTRKQVPLNWAKAQGNLCRALTSLGEQEGGTIHLEKAVAACRAALKEFTQEQAPLDWAKVQINLGATLRILGERKKDATLLCAALEKQLMARDVAAMVSPSTAAIAEIHAKDTVITLKNAFDLSMYEACVAKHAETLKRIGSF